MQYWENWCVILENQKTNQWRNSTQKNHNEK